MQVLLILLVMLPGLVLVLLKWIMTRRKSGRWQHIARYGIAVWAGGSIVVVLVLFANHLYFPLNLEALEGVVLQHLDRLTSGLPVYPEPDSNYVPLAYNVGYYLLATPFTWVFGVNLVTLRFVSILGTVGVGMLLYAIVREKTASRWWGLVTVGLFAAAYSAMDSYLDNAHTDTWFLFLALLGSYIIDRQRGIAWNLIGVLLLVSSFWFKQHGALFAIGGVLYLTWREGVRNALIYWLTAVLFGPALYIVGGPLLFGDRYIYFTWEVPRSWSEFNWATLRRFAGFIAKNYFALALLAGVHLIERIWLALRERDRSQLNIWYFQFVFALATGMLGSLDSGSLNNVYIPMGTFFILMGVLALQSLTQHLDWFSEYRLHLAALVVTFALLAYNPSIFWTPPEAPTRYKDFVTMLNELDGPVYAPWLIQLQSGYSFYPGAHWVALDDMVRGSERDEANFATVQDLLDPVIHPTGSAYVLTNYPLETDPALAFLQDTYVLETDFGDRFAALSTLPKRFLILYPRYLYRYAGDLAIES